MTFTHPQGQRTRDVRIRLQFLRSLSELASVGYPGNEALFMFTYSREPWWFNERYNTSDTFCFIINNTASPKHLWSSWGIYTHTDHKSGNCFLELSIFYCLIVFAFIPHTLYLFCWVQGIVIWCWYPITALENNNTGQTLWNHMTDSCPIQLAVHDLDPWRQNQTK